MSKSTILDDVNTLGRPPAHVLKNASSIKFIAMVRINEFIDCYPQSRKNNSYRMAVIFAMSDFIFIFFRGFEISL